MLLEEAQKVEISPEIKEKYSDINKIVGIDDPDIYIIFDMFDLNKEDWLDGEKMKKIKYIYEWSKQYEDPHKVLRDVDLKLGVSSFKDKLDKIYEFARISGEVKKKGEEFAYLVQKKWQYENSSDL